MKLIIPDTNIFARIVLGLKYYDELISLIAQEKLRTLVHYVILAETFSVLLKAKENQLFGRVDKERIPLTSDVIEEVFEDLMKKIVKLKIDVRVVERDKINKMIEKVKEVCISAFDALTLVVADEVKPDLIVTDDRLFRNRALQRGYKICSEEEIYEKLGD